MNRHLWIRLALVWTTILVILFSFTTLLEGRFIPWSDPDLPSIADESAPVSFLHDPSWPSYAQTEITIHPEPPIAGMPAEICVWVKNDSNVAQTVTIDLSLANFGIGLPFTKIGSQTIIVPPHSRGKACISWIPRAIGHWCFEAVLHQQGFPDLKSQRNIDLWEVLQPGQSSELQFPVRNPLSVQAAFHLEAKVNPSMANWWTIRLSPTDFVLNPEETRMVTLTVTPPSGVKLGTRQYIVDVEASAIIGQQPTLIGGFRKMDWIPVPLHIQRDPSYAESEITVEPYPPAAGEPTRICVELTNRSNVPRTLEVTFGVSAQLGIGLPFTPINTQQVTIPPNDTIKVCTTWVPPRAGQFCVQVLLHDPQNVYIDQNSQRNVDVNEVLLVGQEVPFLFPVRNPNNFTATLFLSVIQPTSFFDVWFEADQFPNVPAGSVIQGKLWVKLKPGTLPEDNTPIADIEAYYLNEKQERVLIGGIRKIYRPPIPIHHPGDPPYAEREISIVPYPPRAGEPTEICVELRNPTNLAQTIWVEFAWANFGIGLPWHVFHGQLVTLPPNGIVKKCTSWVPPFAGHFCAQITLHDPQQRFPDVKSQRNMDIGEVFVRGQSTKPFTFVVGNPGAQTADIELVPIVRLPEWQAVLDSTLLKNVAPQTDLRSVQLTVSVPDIELPSDDTPVVDVEAYSAGMLVGGFRKIYRPPVPIHRPQDPVYAESEIGIHPYPPRAGEPTEISVEIRNPTENSQTVAVTFSVANFGIGLPFHSIAPPKSVTLSAHSFQRIAIMWVPPFGGQFCARVTLLTTGHKAVWSQRNLDVSEILVPGKPSSLIFKVGNPTENTAIVTLGMIPHLENWEMELSQDVLTNMKPGEIRDITLTVTPPADLTMPADGTPVVDVEGYVSGELIGGFRKIYRPPIPIHRPRDPVYAESEIFVDPYPVQVGRPTTLGAEIFNPTNVAQQITVNFSWANFGIGLPFFTAGILTPTMVVMVPPTGSARVKTIWNAPQSGLYCIQIKLQSAGHEPVYSRRNIDVGEPLRPNQPHSRIIMVRNPLSQKSTITMALISHRPEWTISLNPMVLADVLPGALEQVTLTVQPPSSDGLADENPIADVEAYIDGELIGGIRKIAKPPVPLHKPQDRPYAESEISVSPDPLEANKAATIATEIINSSDTSQTIRVEFRVANFGFGIPFGTTGIPTPSVDVTLAAGASQTVSTQWTPSSSGHWCIQITLKDPGGVYPDQRSQRNVDIERRPFTPCVPFTKQFQVHNPTQSTITVTIGISAVNLPAGWTVVAVPDEVILAPGETATITVTITPPCPTEVSPLSLFTLDTGGGGGFPEINVEGYVDGKPLVEGAGIQIRLESYATYLPIVLK